LIARHFGLAYVSTGQMFRDAAALDTEEGRRIRRRIASGELLPDNETYPLVRAALLAPAASSGVVIDGFPRTVSQAVAFERFCRELGRNEPRAVELALPDEVAVARLLGRREGRVDDTRETILHRQEIYKAETAPLLDYYRSRSALLTIDASSTVEEVAATVAQALAASFAD
jgi:adenylate kinase